MATWLHNNAEVATVAATAALAAHMAAEYKLSTVGIASAPQEAFQRIAEVSAGQLYFEDLGFPGPWVLQTGARGSRRSSF